MNAITLVKAARLRTLPLSVSGIITGSAVALREKPEAFRWDIFLLALLTTVLFQILSNFANDYGDGVKGTDNEYRIGPARALQSGAITREQMKRVVLITAALSILSAIALIIAAFGSENLLYTLVFFCVRIALCSSSYQVYRRAFSLWLSRIGRCVCIRLFRLGQCGGQSVFVHPAD